MKKLLAAFLLAALAFTLAVAALPVGAEAEPDFALQLQSAMEKNRDGDLIVTVVLTIGEIKDGVQLHVLLATLQYDPTVLTLLTPEVKEEETRSPVLDCAASLPGDTWENLCRTLSEGEIAINLAGRDPAQIPDAEHPLELVFVFRLKDGCTEATVSIASDTVEGACMPAGGRDDFTVYHGTGSTATATYTEPSDPSESEDPNEPDDPNDPNESGDPSEPEPPAVILGDLGGDGEIDSTDYMLLKRAVLGTFALTEEQQAAADVNGDGEVNSVDYMLVKRHVLGTFVIKQNENK